PSRAVDEFDRHRGVVGRLAQLVRERLVDAPLAGVWIDCTPYTAASLQKFWKHMAIVGRPFHRSDARMMHRHFIFSCASVPHRDCALAAGAQIIPQRHLMHPRRPPIMREECPHRFGAATPSVICRMITSCAPLSPVPLCFTSCVTVPQPRLNSISSAFSLTCGSGC